MKRLIPILLITLSLTGIGCLEKALEYPKNTENSHVEMEKQEFSTVGIIRSINSESSLVQIETVDGFVEEVKTDLVEAFVEGSLLEVHGWRNPTSLIVEADLVNIIDVEKIKILSPNSEATIISPLIVEGFAKTNDGKIYWRIKDSNNAVQLSGFNSIDNVSSYSAFRIEIYLPALEDENFTLEMFSKQSTVEVGLVSLPLNLLSTNTSELVVYFANDKTNTTRDCGAVYPVKREVSQTSATGRASLIELLNGPSESERYQGYRSSIPYNAVIKSFVISDSVAKITISKDFTKTTTCERKRAEEQIKQTLLGIESVEGVVIEVE